MLDLSCCMEKDNNEILKCPVHYSSLLEITATLFQALPCSKQCIITLFSMESREKDSSTNCFYFNPF